MARDPPGIVFQIPGNSITNYAVTAKALEIIVKLGIKTSSFFFKLS